jgi:uncharacterized protein YjbI with pentapeptide repeats
MSTVIHKPINPGEYSNKNLQKASFKNENLSNISFSGSDLRGADFSGSNLSGADLTNAKTGITSMTIILLFFGALAVSLLSGYIAMLAGRTVQIMLASDDSKVRAAELFAPSSFSFLSSTLISGALIVQLKTWSFRSWSLPC